MNGSGDIFNEKIIKPEWRSAFLAEIYGTTLRRVVVIGLAAIVLDIALFFAFDLRNYQSGLWEENPAPARVFLWRCFFVGCFALIVLGKFLVPPSTNRDRMLSWSGAVAIVVFGTWFTIVCQPLIADLSIYALGVFVYATFFPLPGRVKIALYPLSFIALLAGIHILSPGFLAASSGSAIVDGAVIAISAAICDVIVYRGSVSIFVKEQLLEEERGRSDRLLKNMLPETIAEKLKAHGSAGIVEFHGDITILFADFVGFTALAQRVSAGKLIDLLNRLFLAFDEAAERHRIEKIKTIGDSYMAACGVPLSDRDHVQRIANLAHEMLQIAEKFNTDQELPVRLRIGMHTGPAIAGVIGRKKFCYDLWGDTVNVASRLESAGLPGQIHVSEQVYHNLKGDYVLEPRGLTKLKDHGEVQTYLLKERRAAA